MSSLLLRIYDFFSAHRRWLWLVLAIVLLPIVILLATLRYREDIMSFLPVQDADRESLVVQQRLQSASRMVLIVEGEDAEQLCIAIDSCASRLPLLQTEVDMEAYINRLGYIHSQMPYFLSDNDYASLDSTFSCSAIRAAFDKNRIMLSTPGTGLLATVIQSDPLGMLPLSAGARGQFAGAEVHGAFVAYNGYMMTADQRMAFAFYDSPYGSTETCHNAALVDSLQQAVNEVAISFPDLKLRWLGAPIVAVGNARRIKTDSILCLMISLLLIVFLLIYAFPRKRDICLILLTVGFGWAMGMAVLRLFTAQMSIIVLGIGSVLIGIAVNYPLHILVHRRYTSSVRQTLQEVLSPLIAGNITTVGAFLTLLPLKAEALRELGIFAASMLVGTILFCVIFLPHLMTEQPVPVRDIRLITKVNVKAKQILIYLVLAVTFVFAAYLLHFPHQNFDTNLSNINYMTPQQRADFAYFEQYSHNNDTTAVFLAESAREELYHRAENWQYYWQQHSADSVVEMLKYEAERVGFRSESFLPFYEMLTDWQPLEMINTDNLIDLWPGGFDTPTLNAHLTQSLSDNFNYIGVCCSLIVFVFLWFSFGNIWLAIIAFLPMALSWIWILAIMQIAGLQFNIVNIILASFIFGQGDDYTIFVVEGLLYEHRTGKKMLPQYYQSIVLSAIIMLIGIGILVFAVHPAMFSLGAVTLIGMTVVVMMAMTIPPFLFRLLVRWRWVK